MNGSRLEDYVEHIRHEAGQAMKFLAGKSRDDLLEDALVQHAVVMCLINIGEAASKIMDAHAGFAAAHPEVPWLKMRGMRNQVAHGYFHVNFDVVWETVRSSLPALLEQLPPSPEP